MSAPRKWKSDFLRVGLEDRELELLRDEREPEVEVEDVGLGEELRRGRATARPAGARAPVRGRLRSQSAWSGRYGCVLKTTRRASTPRLRSACTFVQPTPARLTGQWVTRRGISASARGRGSSTLSQRSISQPLPRSKCASTGRPRYTPRDVGLLGPSVDLCAGRVLRNGGEGIVHLRQLLAGLSGVGQRAGAARAAERPDLRRGLAAGCDGDLEGGRRRLRRPHLCRSPFDPCNRSRRARRMPGLRAALERDRRQQQRVALAQEGRAVDE